MAAEPDEEAVDGAGATERPGVTDPAGPWSGRVHRVAGGVLLAYVVFTLGRFALVHAGVGAADRLAELSGNVGARLALVVVGAALVHHGLSGLRIVTIEWSGRAELDRWLRPAVALLTPALVLPGAVVVLRPWIEGTLL